VAWKILGEDPIRAEIALSGSFARTYRGHGTDKALIAGIMGMKSDDENIRCSLEIAQARHLDFCFVQADIPNAHPNTARIHLYGKSGAEAIVEGSSIGGGNILIDRVNGMEVAFSGQNNTILVRHHDRPGAIAAVTNFMAYSDVNIGNFRLSRSKKGGEAIMTIEIDGNPPEHLMEQLKMLPHVIDVIMLRAM
jgi:L-serine dehydratase